MVIDGEVGVICSECREGNDASKGRVMTMTSMCCLAEALFGRVCVGFLCVSLSGRDGFHPVLHN